MLLTIHIFEIIIIDYVNYIFIDSFRLCVLCVTLAVWLMCHQIITYLLT